MTSPQDNNYILTIIDHASGYAECHPLARKTSECVWRVLHQEFFPRHGYVEMLLSDLGKEFNAASLTQYLASVGVKHKRTTPYHPQSNGRIERFNRTLKEILGKLVNNDTSLWQEQLGPAVLCYNCAVSDVTQHTPYFLHFGRRPRLPIHRALQGGEPIFGRLHDLYEAL